MIALTVVTLGIWIYGLYFNFKKWGMGSTGYQDELRNSFWLFIATWIHQAFKDGVWVFVKTLILDVLLLRRTLRRSPVRWVMHMTIFYGFLTLAAMSGFALFMDIIEHSTSSVSPTRLRWSRAGWLFPSTSRHLLLFGRDRGLRRVFLRE